MMNVIFAAVVTGAFYPVPNGPFGHPRALQVPWQPVDERGQQVWFQGEIAIGRLHPIEAAHATDFVGETALLFRGAHMLDYGITEDNLEGLIAERQLAAVAG